MLLHQNLAQGRLATVRYERSMRARDAERLGEEIKDLRKLVSEAEKRSNVCAVRSVSHEHFA